MKIRTKATILLILFSIPPVLLVAYISQATLRRIEQDSLLSLRKTAHEIADKIDRNLFERYGDVQAFALNNVINDRTSWYRTDARDNLIAQKMNEYVDTYDIYDLTILVDLDGKVLR